MRFLNPASLAVGGRFAMPDLLVAARFTFRVPVFGFGSSFTGKPEFTVTKAASSETVQWGAGNVFDLSFLAAVPNTIVWGRPNDVRDGGLILDGASTQLTADPRSYGTASWALGGATRTTNPSQATPLGTVGAQRIDSPSNTGYLSEASPTGATGVTTGSAYVLSANGAPAGFSTYFALGAPALVPNNGGAGAAWVRLASTGNANGGGSSVVPVDSRSQLPFGGIAAGARSTYVDLVQREALPFATEWFPSGTRPARYLTMGAAYIAPFISSAGQLGMELVYSPRGGVGYTWTAYLWYMDANNYVALNCATGVLTVRVGGVNNTTSAITWAALDELRFFVQFGGSLPTVVAVIRNGVTITKCSITGSPLGVVTAANANILSDTGTGSGHVYGWLYDINFYRPERQPPWAV